MRLVFEDNQKRMIKDKEEIKFSSFSSFHLIVITARAKDKKQIPNITNGHENLIVRIDNKTFPKLTNNKNLTDSPAAFPDLSKIVYFLTFLKGKDHIMTLSTDKPHNTATLESLEVFTLDLETKLSLNDRENQAEDGDRRSWITFALDNLPLYSTTATITYSRRKRDSDDVKIIIDDRIQGNILRTIKHFLWRFVGSQLPWSSPSKTETETFTVNSPQALHYIEFWADRMPILHGVTLDFGINPSSPEEIPTVDNPQWTEDFYDDTEEMLLARAIYGEVGGESTEAKIAIGWAIRNRVEDNKNRWGKTYHEVVLKPFQYEPFNDPRKSTFKKIVNPPLDNEVENQAW